MGIDEIAIIKYLEGKCTPEERALLEEWVSNSEENRNVYLKTKAIWNYKLVQHYKNEDAVLHALDKLNHTIDNSGIKNIRKIYIRTAQIAALFLLVCSLFFILRNIVTHKEAETWQVVMNNQSNSKLVTLEDGTKIWLNNRSKLTFPAHFSGNSRLVKFSGEAYFEVHHDSLHPFIVQTNSIQVKVLGTSFNLRAFPEDSKSEAVLVNGKVLIQNKAGQNMAKLTPGQLAEYDNEKDYVSIKEVNTNLYTCWRYETIQFNNATIKEIAKEISILYDVSFIYPGKFSDSSQYNFTFRKNQTLPDVLEMLDFITPYKFTKNNKDIVVLNE
jgi:transmembrane sensor